MCSENNLKKYDYFKNINIDYAIDSLTGVLTRHNILGFARYLIENNIEFTMGILDVDNFKLINDNYGHKVGDICLQKLADNLANYVGDDGLVGRFGGDEFIIIWFKGTSYNDIYSYVTKMYNEGGIVRKRYSIENVYFYVTSTIGCASYPKDATNYDDLFLNVDKALYRGKTKGRNCFIVYVEEKHKNIMVNRREQLTIINMFNRISELQNNENYTVEEKIKNILNYITIAIQVSETSVLFTNKKTISGKDGYNCIVDDECLKIFEQLTVHDNIFIPSGFYNQINDEKVIKFVKENNIATFMISRILISKKIFGYIIMFEKNLNRIWQEKDAELLLYFSKVIELLYLKNDNQNQ